MISFISSVDPVEGFGAEAMLANGMQLKPGACSKPSLASMLPIAAECEWSSSKIRLLVVWMVVTCRLGCSGHGSPAIVPWHVYGIVLPNDADDLQVCSTLRDALA